jgi:outer membrane protein assembly factor BamB
MYKLYGVFIIINILSGCSDETLIEIPVDDKNKIPRLEEIWKVETRATASIYPPAYSDGIVYSTIGSDGFDAYDAGTGELIWQVEGVAWKHSGSHARIHIFADKVYISLGIPGEGMVLHCFNKKSGELIFKVPNIEDRCGITDEKYTYVVQRVGNSDYLMAVNNNTGIEVWRYLLPSRLWEPPGLDGEYIYLAVGAYNLGFDIGYLIKLDRNTGQEVFNIFVKAPEDSVIPSGPSETPVFYDNLVIIEGGSRIYAYDKETAELQWIFYYHGFLDAILSALKIENGILYFGTHGTDVLALNAVDGSEIWRNEEPKGNCSTGPVAIYNNLLFIRSTDSYLYCFDKYSGESLFRKRQHWEPIIFNDTLFVGSYMDYDTTSSYYFAAYKIITE